MANQMSLKARTAQILFNNSDLESAEVLKVLSFIPEENPANLGDHGKDYVPPFDHSCQRIIEACKLEKEDLQKLAKELGNSSEASTKFSEAIELFMQNTGLNPSSRIQRLLSYMIFLDYKQEMTKKAMDDSGLDKMLSELDETDAPDDIKEALKALSESLKAAKRLAEDDEDDMKFDVTTLKVEMDDDGSIKSINGIDVKNLDKLNTEEKIKLTKLHDKIKKFMEKHKKR